MKNITILPEIERRLFPLRPEELRQLKESIKKEGVRDPLVVWPHNDKLILLDGHHRYRIALELGIDFSIEELSFPSLEEALHWVDLNQIARRNLTDAQFAVVIGRIYEREKKNKVMNLKQFSSAQIEHSEKEGSAATAKKIAAELGVGQATVRRAAEFAKAVDAIRERAPDVAERILMDQIPDALTELPKIAKETYMLEAVTAKLASGEATRIKEAVKQVKAEKREERLKKREEEAKKENVPNWRLLHGDILEAGKEIASESVHAIITDPPYGKEHLELYDKLGQLAQRVLIPGGICLVMVGQAHLLEYITRLSKNLNYVWTLAYLTPGHSTQVFGRKIKSNWKPILYFSKGNTAWEHVNDVLDVLKSDEQDKRFHEWEQSESGMAALIERFTVPGQTILDPFCGTGTTGKVAVTLGRRFVGIEVDKKLFAIALERLSETY